ncbi:MAG: hypothetical protein WBH47_07835 [Streptosporangiaceae bacterium]
MPHAQAPAHVQGSDVARVDESLNAVQHRPGWPAGQDRPDQVRADPVQTEGQGYRATAGLRGITRAPVVRIQVPADLHSGAVPRQRRQQHCARDLAGGSKLDGPQTIVRLGQAAGDPPVENLLHVRQRRDWLAWLRPEPASHLIPAVYRESGFQIGGGPVPRD